MIASQYVRRGSFAALALAASLAVATGDAVATQYCTSTKVIDTSTTGVVSGVYKLTDSYEATNGNPVCFDMRSGVDLDFNGYSVTCTGSSCSKVVTCAAANSRVRNSQSANDGHVDISGPFVTGVEDCTDHDDLLIDGAATAITSSRLDTVTNSVLKNCSSTCIVATMTANTDRIHDNLIKPYVGDAISVVGKSSSTGPQVDHNLIMNCDEGIYNNDTTYIRISDNIIADCFGASAIDVNTSNKTLTNNVCASGANCAVHYPTDPPTTTVLY